MELTLAFFTPNLKGWLAHVLLSRASSKKPLNLRVFKPKQFYSIL